MRTSRVFYMVAVLGVSLLFFVLACDKEEPVGPEPDTTPPPPVTNLTVVQQQLGLLIDWDVPLASGQPVPDLKGYYIRRDPRFAADSVFAFESSYLDRSVVEGGSYIYTVTSVDDSLNESTPVSSSATIFDTRGPLVTITSPSSGFVTNQSLLTVQGTVIDSQVVATATILLNGASGPQVPVVAGAFSGQVTLVPGTNLIKAQASDPSGNVGTSGEVSVRLDTTAVFVQIAQPADGTITRENRIAVSGSISDAHITTATLIVNGSGATVPVVNGQFTGTASLDEGTNIIRVTATNQAGTSGDSGPVRVTRDTQAPQVRIIQPLDGTPFQGSPIFISGTVTDANLPDSVTLNVAGSVRKLLLSDGQFQAWSELIEGPNQIVVSAVDLAGNAGSASATVYLNSQGPTVRITTPPDGTLLNTRVFEVGGTVTDPAITSGTLFVNGTPQIIPFEGGIFLVSVTVGTDGTHRFWVEVVDQYDRRGVSDTVRVTVDTTPPVLVISSPANGSVGNSPSISVAGQIDDTAVTVVTVLVNGFGITATPHNGSFAVQATLTEGPNTLSARATDAAGNTGTSPTVTATLDTQAQIQEVTHSAVGQVVNVGEHVMFWVNAGEPNGVATVDIGTVHPGIVLYDDGTHSDTTADDGIYTVRYTAQATDEAFQAPVIGRFTDHVGNVALAQTASSPLTINAPPGAVTLVQPGPTQVTSQAVYLRWTASTIPDFRDYRLYRKTSSGVDTTSTLVTTITAMGQDSVFYTDRGGLVAGQRYYYRVYVRDQLGAVAGSNEVSAVIDNWPSEQTYIIPSGDNPCYMARLAMPAGNFVVLSHLSTPGQIRIINQGTNAVFRTLQVPGATVGVCVNPYQEALVAGFGDRKVYRVHGYNLDFTEPAMPLAGSPWDMDCAWGVGDTLYAFAGVGDSIAVMNLYTGNVDWYFPAGGQYAHFGASPDNNQLYAASPAGVIARIDSYSWSISQVWGGFRGIFDMIVTQDYIFLMHPDDYRVTVIGRGNMQVQRELQLNVRPAHCMLLPGNRYLYVSCKDDHVVMVIDTQTWQEVDTIPVASALGMISDGPGNKVYVTRLAGQGGVVVLER